MCYFLPNFVFLPKSACVSLLSEFSGSCFYILSTVSDCYSQEVGLLGDKPKFVCILSCEWLFSPPWTVSRQAPPSMGLSRWEYRRGLPLPPPGDLPDPGIEPMSPALAGGFFTTAPPGRWLDSLADSMNMNLTKPCEKVDRGTWHAAVREVAERHTT